MMNRRRPLLLFFILATVAVVFLAACSEGMFYTAAEDSALVVINTIPDGSSLGPGSEAFLRFTYDSLTVEPAFITVEIRDAIGSMVYSDILDFAPELDALDLSDLQDGRYSMAILVRDHEEALISERTLTFYKTRHEYAVFHVASYPTRVEPDSEVLVFADAHVPPDSNPYIRWKFDNLVLSEGYLSRQGNMFRWRTPQRPGIYTLHFELFPFEPPVSTRRLSAPAPFSGSGSVFTVQTIEAGPGEFSPAVEYRYLHHFRGNFRNYGRNSAFEPRVEGSPQFLLYRGLLGYRFDEDSRLVYNANLIKPIEDEVYERVIQFKAMLLGAGDDTVVEEETDVDAVVDSPDSMPLEDVFAGLDQDLQQKKTTFFTIGDDIALSYEHDEFILRFFNDVFRFEHFDDYVMIGIRLVHQNDVFALEWYRDGLLWQREILNTELLANLSLIRPETVLGSGFPGLIDEFGIMAPQSREERINLFRQAMDIRYGTDLVLAQEFGSGSEFLDRRLQTSDNIIFENGVLVLPADGSLLVEDLELSSAGIELILGAASEQPPSVFLHAGDFVENVPVIVQNDGFIISINPESREDSADDFSLPISDTVKLSIGGPLDLRSLVVVNRRNRIANSAF